MVLQLAFVSPLDPSLAAQRRSGSSLELESNTMKKTENRGLDFRGKAEEGESDAVQEMLEVLREAFGKASEMLLTYDEARIRKSSAMASWREGDVVGEKEGKLNQLKDLVTKASMLIEYCKASIGTSSAMASGRTPKQAPESDAKNLHLRFQSRLPAIFYTGGKVSSILVELIDKSTGRVVTEGPLSCEKVKVVAVYDKFNSKDDGGSTQEDFKNHVVTDRDGKKLLTGNSEFYLEGGVCELRNLTFADNSSWTPNGKIRLAVEMERGSCGGEHVREAMSNPIVVKDCRGKSNEKHERPAPDADVCRLPGILRKGKFHKRLVAAGITEVRHFLWILEKNPQRLDEILETKMADKRWKDLVRHARTCDLSGKYYVYYDEENMSIGVIFEKIFELRGLTEGGVCYSAEELSDGQKVAADNLIREACDACHRWEHIVEYPGRMLSDMRPGKRARVSATHVVTGAPAGSCHTDPQVRGPAVGGVHSRIAGDGPATSVDPSEQDHKSTDMVDEDSIFDRLEAQGDLPPLTPPLCVAGGEYVLEKLPDHSEQDGGTGDSSRAWKRVEDFTTDDEPLLQPAPVVPEQAGGTFAYYDGLLLNDTNPRERERSPPTGIVSENSGTDQQGPTLFGTSVASRPGFRESRAGCRRSSRSL